MTFVDCSETHERNTLCLLTLLIPPHPTVDASLIIARHLFRLPIPRLLLESKSFAACARNCFSGSPLLMQPGHRTPSRTHFCGMRRNPAFSSTAQQRRIATD